MKVAIDVAVEIKMHQGLLARLEETRDDVLAFASKTGCKLSGVVRDLNGAIEKVRGRLAVYGAPDKPEKPKAPEKPKKPKDEKPEEQV